MANDTYNSPFNARYASKEMQYIYSPDFKFKTWRKLWIALAEAEQELGLDITDQHIGELKANADNITAEVKRAQAQEADLAAAIKINADNILLKVSKGNISSEISQEAGKISIKSNRISIESTNFTLTEDGSIVATNATLSGSLKTTKDANRYLQIAGGDIKYYGSGEYKAGIIIDDEGYINLDGMIKIRGTPASYGGIAWTLPAGAMCKSISFLKSSITSSLSVVTGINFSAGSLTYTNKYNTELGGYYSVIQNYTAPSCTVSKTTINYVSDTNSSTENLVSSYVLGQIQVSNGLVTIIT